MCVCVCVCVCLSLSLSLYIYIYIYLRNVFSTHSPPGLIFQQSCEIFDFNVIVATAAATYKIENLSVILSRTSGNNRFMFTAPVLSTYYTALVPATVTLTWRACKYKEFKHRQRYILNNTNNNTNRVCTSGGVYVPCIYTHAR